MLSTGPEAEICPSSAPLKTAPVLPPVRVTPPDAVPVCPLPDESAAEVPLVSFSSHHPAGPGGLPLVSAWTVCEVWLPIPS